MKRTTLLLGNQIEAEKSEALKNFTHFMTIHIWEPVPDRATDLSLLSPPQ